MTTSPPIPQATTRRSAGAMLERVTYANEETGYTIARVATERSGTDLLTVVGPLLGVQPGESLRLVGRWGSHPKYEGTCVNPSFPLQGKGFSPSASSPVEYVIGRYSP